MQPLHARYPFLAAAREAVETASVDLGEVVATDDAVTEMRDAFRERRDMLAGLFAEHDVDVPVGDGAFYMMLPVDDDDQSWCAGAIEDAHVATVPGSAFGSPGYARISYAASEERLREAVDRLVAEGYL